MNTALITDFRHEYELAQSSRLRSRVVNYAVVRLGLAGFGLFINGLSVWMSESNRWLAWLILLVDVAVFITAFVHLIVFARRPGVPQERLLARVVRVIVVTSLFGSVTSFVLLIVQEGRLDRVGTVALIQLSSIFFTHFVACVFLPWSWRESIRPMVPVMILTALLTLVLGGISDLTAIVTYITFLVLCVLALFPGVGIAVWKEHRFAQEFLLHNLGGRYGEMRRELSGAQRIHESLFPKPDQRGRLRFDYRYQPMRSIGGDYLYARFISTDDREEPQLLVLLLDVTGHGIPAALTVNRLYGELERLVGEQPTIMPTDVLRALNRYTFLTLSDHSLFVTAICFRVDMGRGVLHFANAGHPPAYLRDVQGKVTELEPTAMVMGVSRDLDVEQEHARVPFHDGDTLLAYTDGAIEARNGHGRMFNSDGLRDAIRAYDAAPAQPMPMCHAAMEAVCAFRFGPPTDDTLIVEVSRCYAPTGEAVGNSTPHESPEVAHANPSPLSLD